jgi:uroporphyrin-3 C-methyltransferase
MSEQKPAESPSPQNAAPIHGGGARPRASRLAAAALLLAAAAAAMSAWQWYESRMQRPRLEQELGRRLGEIDTLAREARNFSAQSRSSMRDVEARLGQLEARIVETQNQRFALETLYRELLRNRDELILAEVEQILLIASQQLQLAGNVKAALIALEAADARLAQADRPQLTPLRRAIGQDAERLRQVPHVDVTGMGLKIERLLSGIDSMPLAMEARRVGVAAEPAETAPAGGWRRLLAELRQDIKGLVRVQRLDTPDPALLAPEQAFFLRENLRLRLLAARLALLSRDGASFRGDLSAAATWLRRHFDTQAGAVEAALEALAQLARADLAAQPPDIDASLDAVRNFRLVREPGVR